MHFVHVDAVKDQGEARGMRTWLVIADNVLEAMALVPFGYEVTAAELRPGLVLGPGRVIGWLGPTSGSVAERQDARDCSQWESRARTAELAVGAVSPSRITKKFHP